MEAFRYARDCGAAKEDVLLDSGGMCRAEWLYEKNEGETAGGCFRAIADMVWGR